MKLSTITILFLVFFACYIMFFDKVVTYICKLIVSGL